MSISVNKKLEINNKFSDIFSSLNSDLEKINEIIIKHSQGEAELISDIAKHIILPGGKRVRPILTILSSRICQYNNNYNHHYNLAAAVELIHTATLLHDDVVDNGSLRRGKKTANSIWGNKASILVGDYLLSTAFQLMVKSNSIKVLDLLSNTSRIMSDGEVMQLINSSDIDITEKKYTQIISQKTAILFAAATSVGAIISKADQEKERALYDYGINLGIAFQIMDDILDYSSSSNVFGKEIGNDFFEGKVTLPIIITYKRANNSEKQKIKEIFSQNLMSDAKDQDLLQEIIFLIRKYDALNIAKSKALSYHQKALDDLGIFPDSEAKEMLISLLDYAIGRKK